MFTALHCITYAHNNNNNSNACLSSFFSAARHTTCSLPVLGSIRDLLEGVGNGLWITFQTGSGLQPTNPHCTQGYNCFCPHQAGSNRRSALFCALSKKSAPPASCCQKAPENTSWSKIPALTSHFDYHHFVTAADSQTCSLCKE